MKWLVQTQVPEEIHRALGIKCLTKGIDRGQVIRALATLYVEGGPVEKAVDAWVKKFLLDAPKRSR